MKFKRILSAALSAVMAASCLSVGAWAETNDKAENIEEAATSDSALSLTETVSAELADETEYSFGSSGVTYAPGTYDIGVSLKNASNTANDSMAASCIVGGQLIVSDDGTARAKIELTSVTVGTITGWASDWVIYQGTSASGDTVAADGTENSDGNISEIEFDLPNNSYDGVYVNMYIAVMDMSTNAYLAFDYANDSSDDTDDGDDDNSDDDDDDDDDTNVTEADDGEYTADISILKGDSDETSSAGNYFTTTDVPITVSDGKAYVKLAYTNSMIGDISQALDGETYEVLEVSTDEDGYYYVTVELENVDDIENIQLVVNISETFSMTHTVRVAIDVDTLVAVSTATEVEDGEYTADISILKEDSDETSSAGSYFTTTDVPITISDGKAYVKLAYTNSMIGDISQALDGETYEVLEVSTDEDGYYYVTVELENVDDIENVRLVVNTPVGTMTHIVRLAIDVDTLTAVEDDSEAVVYSVPVVMMSEVNQGSESMGNAALDGNAIVTVKNGSSTVELTVKAVYYAGLYGHLIKLWSYPEADEMNYDWWNDSEYEISADIVEYFTDYGLNYTSGDETTSEFPRIFRMSRDSEQEDVIYIRISSDAMEGFDQAARLEFDWANAVIIGDADDEEETDSPVITLSDSSPKNNQTVTVTITAEDGAAIYYTTDGSVPSESSNAYSGEFTVTGSSETITVYAVAIKDGVSSAVSSADIRFTAVSSSSSGDDDDDIADGKYWMDIYLWNANLDQASMGDAAFANNREALVTVSGGTATVQVATNPVSVSGYTSALQGIQSDEVSISYLSTDKFTTNTKYDGSEHTFTYVTMFSFEISDLTTEYADVEISVPYTPMDGITENTGGWIAARLKLNFSGMTEADSDATLTQDSTVKSGSSSSGGSSVSSTNTDTGVKIYADEYVFDDGTEFEIEIITEGESYDNTETALGDEAASFILYSIKAVLGSVEVEPSGTATVYFPVGDTKGKDVTIYRINDDGSKTEIEYTLSDDKAYYVIAVKEFGLFAIAVTGETAEEVVEEIDLEEAADEVISIMGFEDISGHWAEESIIKALELGLFNGMTDTQFGPNVSTTRAMFVTVLGRLMDVSETTSGETGFEDVNSDDYFYPYVVWAYNNGVVAGMSETEFAPYENITREQMAAIITRLADSMGVEFKTVYKPSFNDEANIGSWAKDSVDRLAAAGVINGRTDGGFDPKGTATRAEIATVLVNFTGEYMPEKLEALEEAAAEAAETAEDDEEEAEASESDEEETSEEEDSEEETEEEAETDTEEAEA